MPNDADRRLVATRQAWLLRRLHEDRRLSTNEAAERLGVSVDSVRRDLRALHDRGELRRVHGGAVPVSPLAPSFSGRHEDDDTERTALADLVIGRLRPGQVVGLDAGTTTATIAARLPRDLDITIVTTNPAAVVALADHPAAQVVLTPGVVDLTWMAVTGAEAVDTIRQHHLDLAVVGACSFDTASGATTRSAREQATKRAWIAAAAETVLPMESAKLGTVAPFHIAEADAVDLVVVP